ncbi:enoyl-CoA hydratase [Sphingomonas sp. SKA58]|nr:enoyl-CoA hydratase [Sphingomonas sp. SKA58]
MSPRRIWIVPVRALASVAEMEKENRGFVMRAL